MKKVKLSFILFFVLFFIRTNSFSQDTLINGYILYYVNTIEDSFADEQTAQDFFVFDLPSEVVCFTEYLKKDSIIISFPDYKKCKDRKCYHHFNRALFYKFNDSIESRVKVMKVSYYGQFYNPYDSLTSKDSIRYKEKPIPLVFYDYEDSKYVPNSFLNSVKFFKVRKVYSMCPISKVEANKMRLFRPKRLDLSLDFKQKENKIRLRKKDNDCDRVFQIETYWETF